MSDKIRKYVLPNIPYLFVLWFCLKLGTAYRFAEGVGIGMKLIGATQALGVVFATFAPGLNGFDWLVGIIGAVILRILGYQKVKKAKKYRRDVEYGSVRWGA